MIQHRMQRLGQDQKGAVALLCLAGALILVMMGMLVYDTIEAANDKVHIQASADAAAHTQATVMARTMNMTAFANVGKRINVGYIAAYETMFSWLKWLRNAGFILTAALCVGAFFTGGALGMLCKEMAMITTGAACAWYNERKDHNKLAKVVGATFGPEVRGFNNYQQYMHDVTPYWAWSKGVLNGFENQAPLTVGYPLPGPAGGEQAAQLPIRPEKDDNWDKMCEKANRVDMLNPGSMDRWMMLGDFVIKNVWDALEVSKLIKDQMKGAMSKAFKGDSKSGDVTEDAKDMLQTKGEGEPEFSDEPVEVEGGVKEAEKKKGSKCDYTKQVLKNAYGHVKIDPGKTCKEEDGPDCVPRDRAIEVDGRKIKVDKECSPIDLKKHEWLETVMAISGIAGKSCKDLMKKATQKGGYYGAIFLSGLLALTINLEGKDDSESNGLVDKILWAAKKAIPTFRESCDGLAEGHYSAYKAEGHAWVLDNEYNDWLTRSSALMFAYRPNSGRNRQMSENYFLADAVTSVPAGQESHGYWGLSRGEITWQGDHAVGPSLWESKWAARVRPVALPADWQDGPTLSQAAYSMEAVMLEVLNSAYSSGGGGLDTLGMLMRMGEDLNQDIATGFGSIRSEHMRGVNK